MNNRVWVNNRQPQTLYIAQLLLYFSAVSALIFGNGAGVFDSRVLQLIIVLLLTVGAAAGAFGIANEFKWGYWLGVAAALAPFAVRVGLWQRFGLSDAIQWNTLGLIFDVAIIAALLHQQSAEYQRIYFK